MEACLGSWAVGSPSLVNGIILVSLMITAVPPVPPEPWLLPEVPLPDNVAGKARFGESAKLYESDMSMMTADLNRSNRLHRSQTKSLTAVKTYVSVIS